MISRSGMMDLYKSDIFYQMSLLEIELLPAIFQPNSEQWQHDIFVCHFIKTIKFRSSIAGYLMFVSRHHLPSVCSYTNLSLNDKKLV